MLSSVLPGVITCAPLWPTLRIFGCFIAGTPGTTR